MTAASAPLHLRQLGRQPYEAVWQAMRQMTLARGPTTADELWLVEHDPVYTLGQAARPEHVRAPGDIPVIQVERGGQVSYHGPGQAVVYVLLDLARRQLTVRALVQQLEQATIDWLDEQGVAAQRRAGMPGVYLTDAFPAHLGGAKIAALGLKVQRGCSFHGIALNLAMDLRPFDAIDPCGYPGLRVTDFASARRALANPPTPAPTPAPTPVPTPAAEPTLVPTPAANVNIGRAHPLDTGSDYDALARSFADRVAAALQTLQASATPRRANADTLPTTVS